MSTLSQILSDIFYVALVSSLCQLMDSCLGQTTLQQTSEMSTLSQIILSDNSYVALPLHDSLSSDRACGYASYRPALPSYARL